MSSVKWPMLNLHFWSSFLDISISLFTIPYVLFPAIAGFPLGVLSGFPSIVGAECHMIVTLIGIMVVSMIVVYENRYFILSRNNGIWKKVRVFYLSGSYFLAATFMIPFSMMVPEQETARQSVFERLPCLPKYVRDSPIFVYTLQPNPVVFAVIFNCILVLIGIVSFIILTVRNLLQIARKNSTSSRTLSLQRKFLFGLVIQTTIPFVVIVCPILYLAVSLPQGYYNQAMNNITFIFFSFHGLLSTIAMLLMHQPYRKATLSVLIPCCNKNLVDDTVSTTKMPMRPIIIKVESAVN